MSFRTPKYRLHKGSGQALVQINGERIYLGKYGSEESKEKYKRLVAEYLSSGQNRNPQRCMVCLPRQSSQRFDPGLLAACQAALRQERPAHQRNPQLQDGPSPCSATLRPGTGHQLRPAGPGRLPPEADRSRNLPEADQPARRPYPLHVQVGRRPGDGARNRVAGPVCRRGSADR